MKRTSIIILTYNKLEFTLDCIQSIRDFTESGTYEIIVVDNNSTDGTREWLSEQNDIITVFNNENVGFPKGCNQGMEIASGDTILLLNNDVIVTEYWLENMLLGLYSSDEVGAVGPVSNECPYYQSIEVNYKTIDDMQNFAKQFNAHNPSKWEQRLKLIAFCMLIKREVVNQIGFLDEIFTPGNFEDDDYSFRIMQAGYKLLLCKDTFVHHHGHATFDENTSEFHQIMQNSARVFKEKWGFDSRYSTYIRSDVVNLMDTHEPSENIKVLEIGCACGGTLLEIKNRYKNADLYGIELNENSAEIASLFANVSASNVEHQLEFDPDFFDYIILPDVLEHLNDPWSVLENLKKYLKQNGKVLASIPNVMHYTVLRDTLLGRWNYTDAGLLDRTHLRFFTLYEIEQMFKGAGFIDMSYNGKILAIPKEDEEWISKLISVGSSRLEYQYKVYQYMVKAVKNDPIHEVGQILSVIGKALDREVDIERVISLLKEDTISYEEIIKSIELFSKNKPEAYNYVAIKLYGEGLFDGVIPLLSKSLSIDTDHKDSLYNMGFILYEANEIELALSYLERIGDKDSGTLELIDKIMSVR
ncbi:glycosyltransferase [Paenibacillus crassostreae]|uniref:glycosyltransferase n=1 Tax=Paenibacillus crassostreae TaxID=1763538 RepID=UPI0008398F22|nr:glycosyltransferase [Paenibacillus crassostreae]AOZ93247.1 hypothetical protein LPB68_14200 [Paenibacillus crassostreae]